jgi:spermidine synthase
MGITLPVLCRFYVADLDHPGARTGRLYGINTFGAFIGALSCGFLLIAKLGVYGSLFTAIGINILVGILCIGLAKRYYGPIDSEEKIVKGEDDRKSKGHIVHDVNSPEYDMVVPWALCIFCISGFCAMAYESHLRCFPMRQPPKRG